MQAQDDELRNHNEEEREAMNGNYEEDAISGYEPLDLNRQGKLFLNKF